mmetsp:Transcript_33249/g.53538  ORF Transcript_33249/g.53538 Transcript_33249/m.53538 type:complete len:95 (-) Transcript_33249:797-1081(-)
MLGNHGDFRKVATDVTSSLTLHVHPGYIYTKRFSVFIVRAVRPGMVAHTELSHFSVTLVNSVDNFASVLYHITEWDEIVCIQPRVVAHIDVDFV